ncbi:DUF1049 domain-containing protein [Belnapia sp. T6]|uniref:DUF1049 domain-containing protein n=1 Tax=Belnapia mucosa TaxID=2804532 RepID=A0ABS1V8W1_9PROT|nr:lipopolysaccharide assembly protein LapA domain-containing protein [Belnapia mucosa]MBL6458067.1 DUF1049 domain-containing protein [Belnapia mucosa]
MLRLILLLPLLVILVLFGLSNRQEVVLYLWPFDLGWAVPLSVAMLIFGALCFLFGALVAWIAALPQRARARRAERHAQQMEGELAEFRAASAKRVGPMPAGTGIVALRNTAA